jgi:1-acyl-sn-glycerol-3-phosphate acyltransferase
VSRVILLRSILFNIAFYLNVIIWLIAALPTFFMPYRAIVGVAKAWGRSNLFLLRVICNLKAEFRGVEKIPRGGDLVAAKHQSTWETFALLWMFEDPTFILKRELQWIPLFGWFTIKGRMIPVDRGAGSAGMTAMTARAARELGNGRQIVIFPEGTRRPAGAEPAYKYGIARLYATGNVPCVPIALNSGLFWKRRSIIRMPGTVVVEVLDPIPPGLDQEAFMARLQNDIESATARLIEEGRREIAQSRSSW